MSFCFFCIPFTDLQNEPKRSDSANAAKRVKSTLLFCTKMCVLFRESKPSETDLKLETLQQLHKCRFILLFTQLKKRIKQEISLEGLSKLHKLSGLQNEVTKFTKGLGSFWEYVNRRIKHPQ
eukprot:Platyproteum_vivax@DN7647_c1_g2_i1.p1